MDLNNIEQLLAKYLDGTTSLLEEQQLGDNLFYLPITITIDNAQVFNELVNSKI